MTNKKNKLRKMFKNLLMRGKSFWKKKKIYKNERNVKFKFSYLKILNYFFW